VRFTVRIGRWHCEMVVSYPHGSCPHPAPSLVVKSDTLVRTRRASLHTMYE